MQQTRGAWSWETGFTRRKSVDRQWHPKQIRLLSSSRFAAETAKVKWPSRRETSISTVMVLVMVLLASIFFFAADQALGMGDFAHPERWRLRRGTTMTARWYIVHAYSNFEKKVADSIEEQARQKGLEPSV